MKSGKGPCKCLIIFILDQNSSTFPRRPAWQTTFVSCQSPYDKPLLVQDCSTPPPRDICVPHTRSPAVPPDTRAASPPGPRTLCSLPGTAPQRLPGNSPECPFPRKAGTRTLGHAGTAPGLNSSTAHLSAPRSRQRVLDLRGGGSHLSPRPPQGSAPGA